MLWRLSFKRVGSLIYLKNQLALITAAAAAQTHVAVRIIIIEIIIIRSVRVRGKERETLINNDSFAV